jgi:hypothetical protein
VHERERAAPVRLHRELECVADDALDAVTGVDRLLHRDLVRRALAVEAAGTRVEPLAVLAHDDHVHVVLAVARHERLYAGIAHDGAQVHVLVEPEPGLQQQVALEHPRLHARVSDRPEEDRVEAPEPLELVVRQGLAGAQVSIGSEIELDEVVRGIAPHSVEHLETLADDLGAGAIAADHTDPVRRAHGVSSFDARCALATCAARLTAAR